MSSVLLGAVGVVLPQPAIRVMTGTRARRTGSRMTHFSARNYRVNLHPGRVVTAIDHENLGGHSAAGRAQQKHGGIRHV